MNPQGKTRKGAVYCSIAAISSLQAIQNGMAPVLELIQAHFPETEISLIQMLMTVPSLLAIAMAIFSGWLVTRVSKKTLLIFAGIMTGAVGLLPFLADSFPLLLVSRALYGMPLGLAIALNTAVVADFFQGEERVAAMGFQSVTIGASMMLLSAASGFLGKLGFQYTYFLNLIGFASALVLLFCLPDTGTPDASDGAARPTPKVLETAVYAVLELLFLTSFSTNIAMHLSGGLANDSAVAGMLTGVFFGAQIIAGFVLKYINHGIGTYTIPFAMACFGAGGVLVILFPGSILPLVLGAVLCGLSQGIFVPQSMVEASNAVPVAAAAMAAACVTCGSCLGQFSSPAVLNAVSKALFGGVQTRDVFIVATAGMLLSALFVALRKRSKQRIR